MDEPDEFPQITIWEGDCIDVLANFVENSIDAIVTDPPYGLEFMGKEWDAPAKMIGSRKAFPNRTEGVFSQENGQAHSRGYAANDSTRYQAWCEDWARECLRVLKPGGYLLAFGGTRTYHREACAIEDAGFEIRDSLHWIYGSGFPKSRDIGKAIDKEAGAEREVTGIHPWAHVRGDGSDTQTDVYDGGATTRRGPMTITAPATTEAKEWEGWGTALKPAHEPIVVARKPLAAKHTVAANVLEYGTGAINVDGCRIGTEARVNPPAGNKPGGASYQMSVTGMPQDAESRETEGRWPPNIILTHSPDCTDDDCADDCPVAEMNRQSGTLTSGAWNSVVNRARDNTAKGAESERPRDDRHADTGGASRFFPCFRYNAKAPKKERPIVEGLPGHPTVKPVALMQWLVKLVTPPNGVVLDPFAGTGTTAEACLKEGLYCILIERDPDSIRRIDARLDKYNSTKEAA